MKLCIYYAETNAYNTIVMCLGDNNGKFISYSDIIDGLDVVEENIQKITNNFAGYGFDIDDFNDCYNASEANRAASLVVSGKYNSKEEFLEEFESYKLIYMYESVN